MDLACKKCNQAGLCNGSRTDINGVEHDTVYCGECETDFTTSGEEFHSGENALEDLMVLSDENAKWKGRNITMFLEWAKHPKKHAKKIFTWLNEPGGMYDEGSEEHVFGFTIGQDDAADYWIVLKHKEMA